MKKIFIPVAIVVLILAVIAVILSKTSPTENQNYHVHDDGQTHYYEEVETTYHVHDDGVTHFDEH